MTTPLIHLLLRAGPGAAALAQAGAPADRRGAIIWWLGVIVAAALGMLILALILRKWLSPGDEGQAPGSGLGFTLADLREMHQRGELTDEQFDNAKRAMLARGRAQLAGEDAEAEAEAESAADDEDQAPPRREDDEQSPDDQSPPGQDPPPDAGPQGPDKPDDWPRGPDDPEAWRPGNH